ncbi:toll/interleukin-1 receptor domain-containing protein [bacterium]|nr:toll/interleukin-1 receptor domain-containing protein [bacterium]
MAGINRANPLNESLAKSRTSQPCIFLSHISIDKKIAVAIAEYIRVQGSLDIYLDIYDEVLQSAVHEGDPEKITAFIEKGINVSSHLMCLVSENTVESWWVPYEIGFAKKGDKEISTLTLKNTVTLPAFLEIGVVLTGTKSLNAYLKAIDTSKQLFESIAKQLIPHTQKHPLDDYLHWDE